MGIVTLARDAFTPDRFWSYANYTVKILFLVVVIPLIAITSLDRSRELLFYSSILPLIMILDFGLNATFTRIIAQAQDSFGGEKAGRKVGLISRGALLSAHRKVVFWSLVATLVLVSPWLVLEFNINDQVWNIDFGKLGWIIFLLGGVWSYCLVSRLAGLGLVEDAQKIQTIGNLLSMVCILLANYSALNPFFDGWIMGAGQIAIGLALTLNKSHRAAHTRISLADHNDCVKAFKVSFSRSWKLGLGVLIQFGLFRLVVLSVGSDEDQAYGFIFLYLVRLLDGVAQVSYLPFVAVLPRLAKHISETQLAMFESLHRASIVMTLFALSASMSLVAICGYLMSVFAFLALPENVEIIWFVLCLAYWWQRLGSICLQTLALIDRIYFYIFDCMSGLVFSIFIALYYFFTPDLLLLAFGFAVGTFVGYMLPAFFIFSKTWEYNKLSEYKNMVFIFFIIPVLINSFILLSVKL